MPTLDQSPKSLTPPKKPTLGMVAELAGVSPSTVSRILNGTAKVSPNKMAAVSEAIDMLQFRPDPAARSLAGGRTMSVGVLTQFIDSPYYGEALRGMEDVLRQHQYVPLFTSGHWNEVEERERLTLLQERKVDGIIVLTGRVSDQTLLDIAQDLPIVVIGRKLQGPQVFSIDIDNFEGSRMATRHLISLGHRSIGYVSGPMDHKDAIERLEGYKRELQEKQLPFDPALVVEGDFQESGGFRAMNRLLQSGKIFSAVIAANDQMAYGIRLALSNAGFRVPDDISLVGFDDLPHSAFTVPPLTTVKQSVYEIGVLAANAMLQMLNKEAPAPVSISAKLVARESTRVARV